MTVLRWSDRVFEYLNAHAASRVHDTRQFYAPAMPQQCSIQDSDYFVKQHLYKAEQAEQAKRKAFEVKASAEAVWVTNISTCSRHQSKKLRKEYLIESHQDRMTSERTHLGELARWVRLALLTRHRCGVLQTRICAFMLVAFADMS